ncbi:MAG: hypothetical protein HPY50_15985 [Firmicutes bacterium]|nr:hypothetical protein [Bacillota bacterium]
MIHYTLLDPETVWEEWPSKPIPLEQHTINGVPLLMRRIDQQSWRVEQVLSTDPSDFLLPQYQPGVIYGLNPELQPAEAPAVLTMS